MKEIPEKDFREAQRITREKLDLIVNSMQDLTQICKELKNMLHNLHSEVKDLKKEDKELQTRVKDISMTLNNIKTKKRWFKFL